MGIASDLRRGHSNLARLLGRPTFGYGGRDDYPCTVSSAGNTRTLGLGGIASDTDLTIFVRCAEFASVYARPKPLERLTYNGGVFKVSEVRALPGDELLEISCHDINRKA